MKLRGKLIVLCGIPIAGLLLSALACIYSVREIKAKTQLVRTESAVFDGTSNPLPDHEIAIELGYQCQVRAGWILQPSLQYIVHPGGSEAIDNALVLALRSAFDF